MILYTAVPIELVMQGFGESGAQGSTMEIRQGHAILEVQPIDANYARIVRLISPYPGDYLDPGRSPGAILAWAQLREHPPASG